MREPKIKPWPCALHPESRPTNEARPRCRECKRLDRKAGYDAGKRGTPESQYKTWRAGALRRGQSVDITYRQWLWIRRQPCVYNVNDTRVQSGIDRRDNHRGYVQHNCQPCCYRHNMVKGNVFTHAQMLDIVKRYKVECGDTPRSLSLR